MMYCKSCGKEVDDNAKICPNCGVTLVNSNEDNKSSSKYIVPVVILIAIVCVVIGAVVFMSNSSDSHSEENIKMIKMSTSGYTATLSNKKVYCYCVDGVVKNLPDKGEGYDLKGTFYDDNGSVVKEVDNYLDLDYYYDEFEKSNPKALFYMETDHLVNISHVDAVISNSDGDVVYNETIQFKMENFKLS